MDDTTIEVEGNEYDAECTLEAVERLTDEDGKTDGDSRIEIVGNVAAQCDGDADEFIYLYNVDDSTTLVDKTRNFHAAEKIKQDVEEARQEPFEDVVSEVAPRHTFEDPWSDCEADLDIVARHVIGQTSIRNVIESDDVAVRYVKKTDGQVRVGLSDERDDE